MGFLINQGKISHIKGTNPGPALPVVKPKITIGSVLSLLGTPRPSQKAKQESFEASRKRVQEIETKRSRTAKK